MKRRGMSLAELLITLGLAFMLGMSVMLVVLPSFRIAAEGQIRTELQQQGELTLQQLAADLQASVPTGVSLALPVSSTDGMIVAVHSLSDLLGTSGSLSYRAELKIWWHDLVKRQVFRKIFHNGDPPGVTLNFQSNQSLQTTRPVLVSLCAVNGPQTKSYALSVDNFLVEKESTTGGEVYALKIVLSKVIPGKNRTAVVELFRKVMLRNHS